MQKRTMSTDRIGHDASPALFSVDPRQVQTTEGTMAANSHLPVWQARLDSEGRDPLTRYTGHVHNLNRAQWQYYCPQLHAAISAHQPAPAHPHANKPPCSIFGMPIIYGNHKAYVMWSALLVLIDLVYTTFVLPYIIAFAHEALRDLGWWVQVLVGPFFVADLVIGFHTAYVVRFRNQKGVIEDGRLIAEFYIKHGTFVVDLMSVLPWLVELAFARYPNKYASIFAGIVRLGRLYRVVDLFKGLLQGSFLAGMAGHVPISTRTMYAITLGYAAAALINLLGCFLVLISVFEGQHNSWLTSVRGEDMTGARKIDIWVAACYWALTTMATVGYGEIVPINTVERIAIMAVMVVGAVFFGFVIGALAEALTSAGSEGRRLDLYRRKMHVVDECLSRLPGLPSELRQRIYSYYSDTWVHQQEEEELWADAVDGLPPTLRASLALHLILPALRRLATFADFTPRQLRHLASQMVVITVAPGNELCQEGDEGDCMWVLSEGRVLLSTQGQVRREAAAPALLGSSCVAAMHMGEEADGDLEFWHYSLTTATGCTLWRVDRKGLEVACRRVPGLGEALWQAYQQKLLADVAQEDEPTGGGQPWSGSASGSRRKGRLELVDQAGTANGEKGEGAGGGSRKGGDNRAETDVDL